LIPNNLRAFPPILLTCLGGNVKPKFEQFIRERKYLSNVSPATVEWYKQSLNWLDAESPTDADLKDFVIRMREKGLKASACNNRIRAVNAYLKWLGSPLRVPKMKEPQFILPTFSLPQVSLLTAWKPKDFFDRRLHLLVLVLLDTGCRISEALSLRVGECDPDNLLVTLNGKGQKQRKVPSHLSFARCCTATRTSSAHSLTCWYSARRRDAA
jgi:integrase/recombinase XerD